MAEDRHQYGKHAVSAKEVRQIHTGAPEYFENEGEARRAPVVMVGPTESDRMIVVPIEPTHTRCLWRPVTAFEANAHDRDRYCEEKAKQ